MERIGKSPPSAVTLRELSIRTASVESFDWLWLVVALIVGLLVAWRVRHARRPISE